MAQAADTDQAHEGASAIQRWTSDDERAARLAALRKMMESEGFDALVICGRDDIRYRGRTFYVTDVWQLLADTHVVLFSDGAPIFIGGQVFGVEQAELTDWASEFRVSGTPGTEIARVLSEHGDGKGNIGADRAHRRVVRPPALQRDQGRRTRCDAPGRDPAVRGRASRRTARKALSASARPPGSSATSTRSSRR